MITEECIITFPTIFEPAENLSGVLKYSASFMFDKSDEKAIAQLEAEIKKAHAAGVTKGFWRATTKISTFKNSPFRDGDEELESGEKEGAEYKGRKFLNASAAGEEKNAPGVVSYRNKPGVVGPDAKPLFDQEMLYSGCIVRADIKAFPYKAGGNTGIGWWLNNVMVIKDGPRLDGKMNAVDAFAGFATEAAMDTTAEDDLA